MKILEVQNLKKYYGDGDTMVKALNGVDLSGIQIDRLL